MRLKQEGRKKMGEVARRLCTLLPAKQDNEGSYRSTVLPLKELFVGKKIAIIIT